MFYIEFWKGLSKAKGTIKRREYWLTIILNLVFYTVVCTLLPALIMLPFMDTSLENLMTTFAAIISIVGIVLLTIGSITMTIRRLHDIGKCGWWALLGLVPIGNIILLAFTLYDSKLEGNSYRLK